MKSILLIMPYGSVGGMERLAFNFFTHYKAQGYIVKAIKIVQLPSDIIYFQEDEIALSKVDFCEMSFAKRFLFYCKIPFLINGIIKKYGITHSIAFGDMANVFSSLSFTKEYKIASIHALKSVEFVNKNFLSTIFKLAFKSSYYFFDKVVCISEAIKKDLIEKCGYTFIANLTVIYNPHNIKQIEEMALLPLESNHEKALFQNQVILFLGRLTIQKAPWHLIKAFSLLENPDNKIKLVLLGDGNENVTDYLLQLVEKLKVKDNVVFLGRKSNPYQYLKQARILALTSYYEGTPNVVVEAIATGTPIVSSNCTDGIMELMSLKTASAIGELIETESGIITPSFFKGNLAIPSDEKITAEEKVFANVLQMVLGNTKYQQELLYNKKILVEKFDLEKVAQLYLY
jgi:glycosyltransferase involved in cell wall biosynthesis